jgi:hypothetical protein
VTTSQVRRSIIVTVSPLRRVMPLSRYHCSVLSMMSSTVFSPASTGDSRMRL